MRKTVSILLSILLLTGSTGLVFGQHLCKGKVVGAAMMVGQQKMDCGSLLVDLGCNDEKSGNTDCCDNVYHQVETDTHYSGNHFSGDFNTVFIVSQSFVLSPRPFVPYLFETISFSEYLPPPLPKDIPVLYQTFLI